jgi:CHAD domain-containing protein
MEKVCLKSGEDIKVELKRMILKEVDYAIDCIQDKEQIVNIQTHEIRKAFKVIRAILRMVRYSVGYSDYFRENIFFRDLSRHLSEIRDNEVLLQRAEIVQKNMPPGLKNADSEKLINELNTYRDRSLQEIVEGENLFKLFSDELNHSTAKIDNLQIRNEGFGVIENGIKRTYKQALKYLKKTADEPGEIHIHEFRKRAKYLWYQLMILKPLYYTMLKAFIKSLKNISEDFGLHRDYTLYIHLMKKNNYFGLKHKQVIFIQQFTHDEQLKIYKNAIELAKKFFIESPDDFVSKLKKYYELSLMKRTLGGLQGPAVSPTMSIN